MERSEARRQQQIPDPEQRATQLRGLAGISAETLTQARVVGREASNTASRLETKSQENLGRLSPPVAGLEKQAAPASRERLIQKAGTALGRPTSGQTLPDPASLVNRYRGTTSPTKTTDQSREKLGNIRAATTPTRAPAREQAPPKKGLER